MILIHIFTGDVRKATSSLPSIFDIKLSSLEFNGKGALATYPVASLFTSARYPDTFLRYVRMCMWRLLCSWIWRCSFMVGFCSDYFSLLSLFFLPPCHSPFIIVSLLSPLPLSFTLHTSHHFLPLLFQSHSYYCPLSFSLSLPLSLSGWRRKCLSSVPGWT